MHHCTTLKSPQTLPSRSSLLENVFSWILFDKNATCDHSWVGKQISAKLYAFLEKPQSTHRFSLMLQQAFVSQGCRCGFPVSLTVVDGVHVSSRGSVSADALDTFGLTVEVDGKHRATYRYIYTYCDLYSCQLLHIFSLVVFQHTTSGYPLRIPVSTQHCT